MPNTAERQRELQKCVPISVTIPLKLVEAMDIEITELIKDHEDFKADEGRSGIVRRLLARHYHMPDATEILTAGRPKQEPD
jgi:hypothetical protein